jgi:glycosyltransferase involved in cell wall biosynthesis
LSNVPKLPIRSVVVFSPYQWEHALVSLRITRPLQLAGFELIRGNQGMEIHPERVAQADAILLQREFPENLEVYDTILSLARAARKPVIYEIDDLLFELPESHIDYPSHYYSPALFAMLRAVIEADLVTVTTAPLQAYLARFNPQTLVLPNYLDDQLWQLRTPGTDIVNLHGVSGPVVIGYMGSNTHQPDLATLTPLLSRLLDRYGERLKLRFWSAEPPESLRQHPQVEWVPVTLHSYAEFAAYFSTQSCDLFVAPLIDSEFNRCKSEIKFLEYSSLGIPGVYSRMNPYQAVIQDGQNGYLAADEAEWEQCLVSLIESPDLRAQMGQKAQETIRQHWLLSQHAGVWTNALEHSQQIAADDQYQRTRSDLLQTYITVANQVRGWQNKIYNQVIERDMMIQHLQAELEGQKQLVTSLQAQISAQTGLIQTLARRMDHALLQTARKLKRRLRG